MPLITKTFINNDQQDLDIEVNEFIASENIQPENIKSFKYAVVQLGPSNLPFAQHSINMLYLSKT